MKKYLLTFSILALQFSMPSASASEPTLARLSFFIPSERSTEFETAYTNKALPVLKTNDFDESSETGRVVPDSIFGRLFEFPTVQDYRTARDRLPQLCLDPCGIRP